MPPRPPLRATRAMVDDGPRDPDLAQRRRLQRGGASRGRASSTRATTSTRSSSSTRCRPTARPRSRNASPTSSSATSQHGHAEPSRELAAARSSGDWILILDADEKMSDLLKAELREPRRARHRRLLDQQVEPGRRRRGEHRRALPPRAQDPDPLRSRGPTAARRPCPTTSSTSSASASSTRRRSPSRSTTTPATSGSRSRKTAPTSAKRNWLQHNRTLRAERARERRTRSRSARARRLPSACSSSATSPIELAGRSVSSAERAAPQGERQRVRPPAGGSTRPWSRSPAGMHAATLRSVAGLVRPGGVIVGTVARRAQPPPHGGVHRRAASRTDVASSATPHHRRHDPARAAATTSPPPASTPSLTIVRDGWLKPGRAAPGRERQRRRVRGLPAQARHGGRGRGADRRGVRLRRRAHRQDARPPTLLRRPRRPPGRGSRSALRTRCARRRPQQDYELVVVASQRVRAAARGRALGRRLPSRPVSRRGGTPARAPREASCSCSPPPRRCPSLAGSTPWSRRYRSRPDTGCAGSKILAEDGTIGHAGLVLGPDRIPYRLYEGEPADAAYVNRPRIMPAVLAEGMVTSRAQFVAIGGFDETLGEDLADADYCMRLRARGCPVLYAPAGCAALAAAPGARHAQARFRRSAREFATRWSPTAFRSDALVCRADGRDANWEWNRSWRLPRPTAPQRRRTCPRSPGAATSSSRAATPRRRSPPSRRSTTRACT